MDKQHALEMSKTHYPKGLRIVECKQCRYAFGIEVDHTGTMLMETRVLINQGDPEAAHGFFQTPVIEIELGMTADTNTEPAVGGAWD